MLEMFVNRREVGIAMAELFLEEKCNSADLSHLIQFTPNANEVAGDEKDKAQVSESSGRV